MLVPLSRKSTVWVGEYDTGTYYRPDTENGKILVTADAECSKCIDKARKRFEQKRNDNGCSVLQNSGDLKPKVVFIS